MPQYLLDTNICIYYLKNLFQIEKKIKEVELENCFISEITVAELKFGASNSSKKASNKQVINKFIDASQIVPIITCLDFYADEKARLRQLGTPLDEFDLLIGCSAVVNEMVLVTNNEKHFTRIQGIQVENWTH